MHGTGLKFGDSFYWVTDRTSQALRNSYAKRGKTPPASAKITKIELDGTEKLLDPAQPVKLGPYGISLECNMVSDCEGTMYVLCDEAHEGNRKLGPGVLVYPQSPKRTTSRRMTQRR